MWFAYLVLTFGCSGEVACFDGFWDFVDWMFGDLNTYVQFVVFGWCRAEIVVFVGFGFVVLFCRVC